MSPSSQSCSTLRVTRCCTDCSQLGYADVASVRVGKYLEVTLAAADQSAAEESVRQMCDKLLANPVIERYDFTVTEKSSASA